MTVKLTELKNLPKYTGPCAGCIGYNKKEKLCEWDAEYCNSVIDCELHNIDGVLINQ